MSFLGLQSKYLLIVTTEPSNEGNLSLGFIQLRTHQHLQRNTTNVWYGASNHLTSTCDTNDQAKQCNSTRHVIKQSVEASKRNRHTYHGASFVLTQCCVLTWVTKIRMLVISNVHAGPSLLTLDPDQSSATYGPWAGSGLPSKIIRPAAPLL